MKKIIYTLLITLALTNNSFSAGSSNDTTPKVSDYTKAKNLIKSAKKYEKKGKTEKAQKRYAKAQKLLIKSNEKKPLQADTLGAVSLLLPAENELLVRAKIISKV